MLEPSLTESEQDKLKSFKDDEYVKNAVFWSGIYNRSTGADHIKALKNINTWAGKFNDARKKYLGA